MRAPSVRHHRTEVNGVTLHHVEAGPSDGQVVFLLHGFPEFWYAWREQIELLTSAGYRVFAVDQRGYNLSDKPSKASDYDLDTLGADIIALADAIHVKKFTVVGHDVGAFVGWWMATHRPDRVARLVAMSAPHPAVWRAAMDHDADQQRAGHFAASFKARGGPELMARLCGFRTWVCMLQQNNRPHSFNETDFDEYRKAWSQPGALTGMLNWYRCLFAKKLNVAQSYRVSVPVLLLWGSSEPYCVRRLAQASIGLCDHGHLLVVDQATHWIHHDEPDRLNMMLLDFLQGRVPRVPTPGKKEREK